MRAVIPVLLVASLATGCVTSAPEDVAPAASAGGVPEPSVIVDPTSLLGEAPATLDAPVWLPGDAWEIAPSGDAVATESTVVVTAASPDAYVLSTTSEELAGFDAIFDVSYIGRIRASDLAGEQQGQLVVYFSFPLTDGKSWTTRWDGRDVTLTATRTARGFDIMGVADGEPYVTYDYAPDLKWWSFLEFAGGFGIKVVRHTSDWRGDVVTAVAKELFRQETMAPVASPASGAFTIEEGQTFALLSMAGGGAHWVRGFALTDPTGAPYMGHEWGNAEIAYAEAWYDITHRLPAMPGTWHIFAPLVHGPEGGGRVLVHQVAVQATAFP